MYFQLTLVPHQLTSSSINPMSMTSTFSNMFNQHQNSDRVGSSERNYNNRTETGPTTPISRGQENIVTQILQRPQQQGQEGQRNPTQHQSPVSPLRTPLALLNEVLLKSKITAKVDVSKEELDHTRTFTCKIKVEQNSFLWETSAMAANKKDAKQAAAKAILLKMDERAEELISYTPQSQRTRTESLGGGDGTSPANPVGDLNNICMLVRMPTPEYEDAENKVNPCRPTFKVICRLNSKTVEEGLGETKKIAKRAAAEKVLQKLKDAMEEPTIAPSLFPESEQDLLCKKLANLSLSLSKKKKLGPVVQLVLTEPRPLSLPEVLQSLKTLSGPKLEILLRMKTVDIQKSDQTLILALVAAEQNWKLEYLDFPPAQDAKKYQSVVSVGLGTRVIFMGNGTGIEQARKSAAFMALEYLRLAAR